MDLWLPGATVSSFIHTHTPHPEAPVVECVPIHVVDASFPFFFLFNFFLVRFLAGAKRRRRGTNLTIVLFFISARLANKWSIQMKGQRLPSVDPKGGPPTPVASGEGRTKRGRLFVFSCVSYETAVEGGVSRVQAGGSVSK